MIYSIFSMMLSAYVHESHGPSHLRRRRPPPRTTTPTTTAAARLGADGIAAPRRRLSPLEPAPYLGQMRGNEREGMRRGGCMPMTHRYHANDTTITIRLKYAGAAWLLLTEAVTVQLTGSSHNELTRPHESFHRNLSTAKLVYLYYDGTGRLSATRATTGNRGDANGVTITPRLDSDSSVAMMVNYSPISSEADALRLSLTSPPACR